MMNDQRAIELAQQINTHAEMMARLEAMKAANEERRMNGYALAYDEEAFFNLTNELGCHHNVRCSIGHD